MTMAKKILAVTMMVAMALTCAPLSAFAAQAQAAGTISGTATSQGGQSLATMTAQLRNLTTKQLVGTTTTNAQGAFSFTGLNPGQFMVEVVNAQGAIVGTTSAITLSAGAMVATGVAVTATAAGAIAGGAAAAGGLGAFFGTTAGIVTGVAVAGAVTAIAVKKAQSEEASPSR
jgi:hypothetical protein